jgi:hypothetical protein
LDVDNRFIWVVVPCQSTVRSPAPFPRVH